MRLAYTLMAEATESAPKWTAYQLKDSPVLVACRMVRGTCEMRIAHKERITSEQWKRELAALEKFLGVMGWKQTTDAKAKGTAILYEAP